MIQSRTAKVFLLSFGNVLSFSVSILSAAVLSRIFSKPDYATYQQVLLVFAMASPLVIFGLNQAPYYFLPNNAERSREILLENLTLLAVGGILLALFTCFGGKDLLARQFNNANLSFLLLVMAAYPLLTNVAGSLSTVLMAQGRASWVAGYSVISRLIILLMVVIPGLIWRTPLAALSGHPGGRGRKYVDFAGNDVIRLSARQFSNLSRGAASRCIFSVPIGLASIIGIFSTYMDQFVVSSYCDKATAAIYFNVPGAAVHYRPSRLNRLGAHRRLQRFLS